MINPTDAFLKNNAENIVHRKNLTTGIVKVVNANKSFDVEIGNCGKICKRIFTLSPDPDLAVEDKVRIGHMKGNKEDPIIFAPTKLVAPAYIIAYVYYSGSNNYLVILDADGNILDSILTSTVSYATDQDAEAVDSNGNIYIAGRWADKVKKLDSEGSLLVEIGTNLPFQIAINPNGDIWLYEWTDDNLFVKRDPRTLAKLDEIALNLFHDYMGLTFDSAGYLYAVNWVTEKIEKWDMSSKTKVAERDTGLGNDSIYCSLAAIGSNVYMVNSGSRDADYWVIPTSLSSNFVGKDLSEFGEFDDVNFITALGGTHFVVEGIIKVGAVKTKHILKYDSNWNLIWDIPITATGAGLGVAAYPF